MSAYVGPDRAQLDAFNGLDRDAPLNMLNLVALNGLANYPGDHDLARDGLSGAHAYRNYGKASAPVLARVGGSIVWRGAIDLTLIGPSDEVWDVTFIVAYPSAHALLAMISDPEYQQSFVHRKAGVRTSRLARSRALPNTDGFA